MKRMLFGAVVVAGALAVGQALASTGLWPHVYTTRITGATPAALNGTWRLSVGPASYAITKNGRLAVGGTATYAGHHVTLHDLTGSYRCRGSQAVGTYAWSVLGNKLTLRVVKDACSGRKAILTNGFTRVA